MSCSTNCCGLDVNKEETPSLKHCQTQVLPLLQQAKPQFTEKLKCTPAPAATVQTTKGGNFTSNQKACATLKLPKFNDQKAVEWDCDVDPTKSSVHQEPGMLLDCKQCVMTWGDIDVQMKSTNFAAEDLHSMLQDLTEPEQAHGAAACVNRTLAAMCKKADSDHVTDTCKHVSAKDRANSFKLITQETLTTV